MSRSGLNEKYTKEDLLYNWHPCTQMKEHEKLPLIPIKKAKGVYLYDFEQNCYIDAISSWWVNLFGHKNRYISKKIKKQLKKAEHIIFAGFTHKQIIRLGKRLTKLTGLDKCFYADNGSSAVEIAIKMAFHYYKNLGKIKPYILSLKNSYHGETIGALSVGDVELYKKTYKEILIKSFLIEPPIDKSKEAAINSAKKLEVFIERNKDKICAFILEPLVQCAGYMKMYHPLFIKLSYEICKKNDILFIADEIAVGFGRTGSMFACEQAGIKPDIMCLSKGLTGGFLPLSVVLVKNFIYEVFYDDYSTYKAFLHSHSYSGNPLSCAAANATLDIFEKKDVLKNNEKIIKYMEKELKIFLKLDNIKEIRQQGMICAIELKEHNFNREVFIDIYKFALKNGVLIRPLWNVVYFMPPYIIKKNEIDKILEVAYEGIKRVGKR